MLSRAQNTFHHNPRLRGPVSSIYIYIYILDWETYSVKAGTLYRSFRVEDELFH